MQVIALSIDGPSYLQFPLYIGCQIYFLLRHLLKEHGPYTFQPIFLCPIIKVQSYQVSPVIFGSVLQFMNVHVSKTICPDLVNQFHVLMTHFFFLFHPLTLLILSTVLQILVFELIQH